MKKIFLVTGGAGFIGSNIVEELLRRGQSVRVLDNFCTGKKENLDFAAARGSKTRGQLEVVEGDIRDRKDLSKALKDAHTILHQAALRSVPRSVDDPFSTNDVNVAGTLELLAAARAAGASRVVYASSSSVYGDSRVFPQKETQTPSPLSPYAVSKLAAENYCGIFAKTFGLETVSLRYFNVFGPRQNPESKYAAVVPKFIESAARGIPLEVHGDGKQSRDFSYVSNVVAANLAAAAAPSSVARSGPAFNIACGETHSLSEMIKILEKIFGRRLAVRHAPTRAGDVRKTRADISAAKKHLGYSPSVSFESGIAMTVKWYLASRERRISE